MKTNPFILLFIASITWSCSASRAQDNAPTSQPQSAPDRNTPRSQPIELGVIQWSRDLDKAKIRSKKTGKPLLILFNEVPGCDTVRGFGKSVLSDLSIKSLVETHFVPVYIQNNSGGKDAEILKEYGEPSWNNPIVRSFDPDGKEIAKRFNGPYGIAEFKIFLHQSLKATAQHIPDALKTKPEKDHQKAVFAMYCFWTGEAKFGNIEGVVQTRPGFQNGHEVVEVTFDTAILSYDALSTIAAKKGIADVAIVDSKAQFVIAEKVFESVEQKQGKMRFSKKDDKYFLNRSPYKNMKLTAFQSTKINAALKSGGNPDLFLKQ